MTVVSRKTKPVPRKQPEHEVRCAIMNAAKGSISPISQIVHFADAYIEDGDQDDVVRGLVLALSVLTCLDEAEVRRQLSLSKT